MVSSISYSLQNFRQATSHRLPSLCIMMGTLATHAGMTFCIRYISLFDRRTRRIPCRKLRHSCRSILNQRGAKFYTSIFKNSKIGVSLALLGEASKARRISSIGSRSHYIVLAIREETKGPSPPPFWAFRFRFFTSAPYYLIHDQVVAPFGRDLQRSSLRSHLRASLTVRLARSLTRHTVAPHAL
jgi:hypothetical protein